MGIPLLLNKTIFLAGIMIIFFSKINIAFKTVTAKHSVFRSLSAISSPVSSLSQSTDQSLTATCGYFSNNDNRANSFVFAPEENKHMNEKMREKRVAFNINVGKAYDTLRRELPLIFVTSSNGGDLDFSIFADQISVVDGNFLHLGHGHKLELSKSIYKAAVKSLQLAASFSSIYPSINIRKIEYLDENKTIQCLVDIVLPDSVRVNGLSVWEGMFYFEFNNEGFIKTHVFDRKISNFKSSPLDTQAYPWFQRVPAWSPDLVGVGSFSENGCI